VQASVQDIRPYIVCALVRNLDLSDMATFRKFINIQVQYSFILIFLQGNYAPGAPNGRFGKLSVRKAFNPV